MATKFVPIVPKELNANQLLNGLRKVVKKQAGYSNTQFGLTYKTWQHKPDFKEDFNDKGNKLEGIASTSGEGSKDNPYPFITKGTPVRYATMTPDFSPKSRRRVIGSRGGRGGVAFINKNKPRPGIEAREFEEEIAKREQPKFETRAQKALDSAAKRSKHAI